MKNLYHKVAVASVCTALGFALGANKEAKAASGLYFSFPHYQYASTTYHAIDNDLDGVVDAVTSVGSPDPDNGYFHSWNYPVERTTVSEIAAVLGFKLPSLAWFGLGDGPDPTIRVTSIYNAVVSIPTLNWPPYDLYGSRILGLFGYSSLTTGSDLEAGVLLGSVEITEWGRRSVEFDVTSFLNEQVTNNNQNNQFATFAVRSLKQNSIILPNDYRNGSPPMMIAASGEYEIVEPEPVPEPTTIFGSAIALGVGGWLKRKKSSQQNKTTPQH